MPHDAPSLPRQTVFVVEDDYDLRCSFRDTSRVSGFDVQEAVEGFDALRIIENDPPDLVVLDLMLPILDGLSVRDELLAHVETRPIPVIIVTGSAADLPPVKGHSVLRKPASPGQLDQR